MAVLGPDNASFPVGTSDYRQLRREGLVCVDKTAFIADVLDGDARVTLYPRPRRFGKTLNMSMLQAFLEKSDDDPTDVFEDTAIWQMGDTYRQHFRKWPVIALSFKDLKSKTWEQLRTSLTEHVCAELERTLSLHAPAILSEIKLGPPPEASREVALLARAWRGETTALSSALDTLGKVLHSATGSQVVMLIDEYDTPLHAAWQYGYWDDALPFFRDFLSGGLKDVPHLFRAVLTGILRVAKENLFSGLNNVAVHGILDAPSCDRFGFTEDEVEALAKRAGLESQISEFRSWYNGYRFGGISPVTIYNPWSIVRRCANAKGPFESFWVNVSDNALARTALARLSASDGAALERMLSHEAVEVLVDGAVALQDLALDDGQIWPLLMLSGYLTAEHVRYTDDGPIAALRIPNREVAAVYRSTFLPLAGVPSRPSAPNLLTNALLAGRLDDFAGRLGDIITAALSHHDTARFPGKPVESIYHAFILGLFLHLAPTHEVVSNREAGYGRADVLIYPKVPGQPGVVLELKVVDTDRGETPEAAIASALDQLASQDYAASLRARGAHPIHEIAIAFHGKRCWSGKR